MLNHKSYSILILLFAVLLNFPTFASGGGDDDPPLSIDGLVEDQYGAPISGATIKLFIAGEAAPLVVTQSEYDGSFQINNLAAKTYDLVVSAPGHSNQTLQIVLTKDQFVTVQLIR